MIKFQNVGFKLLIFLIVYWSFVIFATVFLTMLCVAIFFFLTSDNPLNFDWLTQCISAARKGISAGTVLGFGIWIKSKIEENKRKKTQGKTQK